MPARMLFPRRGVCQLGQLCGRSLALRRSRQQVATDWKRSRQTGWRLPLGLALFLPWVIVNGASAAVSGTKSALVMLVSLSDAPIDCSFAEVNGFFFTNSPLNVDSY